MTALLLLIIGWLVISLFALASALVGQVQSCHVCGARDGDNLQHWLAHHNTSPVEEAARA